MASTRLEEELKCSICLSIFTDPVTLSCGHNFCLNCILDSFKSEEYETGRCSCPQCRTQFQGRPALQKNTALCYIVETYLPSLQEGNSEKLCPLHGKPLIYYCFQDTACICASCILVDKHRGHKIMSRDEALGKKMQDLVGVLEQMTLGDYPAKNIQQLCEQSQRVKDHASNVKEIINVCFQDISDQLAELKDHLISKVTEEEDVATSKISSQIQQLESRRDEINNMKLNVEKSDKASILRINFSDLRSLSVDSPDLDEGAIWEVLHNGLDNITTEFKNRYGSHQP